MMRGLVGKEIYISTSLCVTAIVLLSGSLKGINYSELLILIMVIIIISDIIHLMMAKVNKMDIIHLMVEM